MSATEHLGWVLLATFVAGFLLGAPIWIAYALRTERDRREWQARRQERNERRYLS